MTEKIANFLYEELCGIYCNTCKNDLDDDLCGDCHRKYMNWAISRSTAEELAARIVKIINEE